MSGFTKGAIGVGSVVLLVSLFGGSNTPQSYTPPTQEVVAPTPTQRTQTNSNCHPSYSGCLRADASDYDCAGGSGNGPYYTGTVRVTGPDVFGLDRDNDGWGCE